MLPPHFTTRAGVQAGVVNADAAVALAMLPPASVQACITSPPYWGMRDYNHPDQIGAEDTPELYVERLVGLFRLVRRALRPDGTLWLNLGDGYARNGGVGKPGPNARVGATAKAIQGRNCKVPKCWGLKDRDLLGLPWRLALALQQDGWWLRSHITWVKRAPMPENVFNRPSQATEDLFLLTRSARYYYDYEAVKEDSGARLRNVWTIGHGAGTPGHPAAFPRELARRCLLLGSRPGDRVLDPFAGSGTVGVEALASGRHALLCELNPDYVELSRQRLAALAG